MKRAIRRHHRQRLKNNRKNHYWWWTTDETTMFKGEERNWNPQKSPRQLGILVSTPCLCSCYDCTNIRNRHGRDNRSLKEKEFDLKFQEQYEEFLQEEKS